MRNTLILFISRTSTSTIASWFLWIIHSVITVPSMTCKLTTRSILCPNFGHIIALAFFEEKWLLVLFFLHLRFKLNKYLLILRFDTHFVWYNSSHRLHSLRFVYILCDKHTLAYNQKDIPLGKDFDMKSDRIQNSLEHIWSIFELSCPHKVMLRILYFINVN